jgi:hypothetical protein
LWKLVPDASLLMGIDKRKLVEKTRQPELRKSLSNPAHACPYCTKPDAAAMQSRKSLSSGWPVFSAGFSQFRLARLRPARLRPMTANSAAQR